MTAPNGPWGPTEEAEEEPARRLPGWVPLAALMGLAALGLLALNAFLPHVLEKEDNLLRLLFLIALLALIGGGAVSTMRHSPMQILKQAAAWIGIFAAIGVFYIIGRDAGITSDRLLSEIAPSTPQTREVEPADPSVSDGLTEQVVTVRRGHDGHFRLRGRVNGYPVEFLVDTGASLVVLAPPDARRAGFNPGELDYNGLAQTANGTAPIAYVTIPELEVGDFVVRDVPAAVAGDGLRESLLGMSLLDRLEGFTVSGETMELKPPRY